jgi:hypothetical protein
LLETLAALWAEEVDFEVGGAVFETEFDPGVGLSLIKRIK